MSLVNRLQQITPEIIKNFPSISVMYLFGSQATGKAMSGSDVDIAVFTDNSEDATMDLELSLFIQQQLKLPVDTVILQKASPVLQHEVLRHKTRIFERDPVSRAILEARSFREFLDARHFQRKRQLRRNSNG